MSRHTNGWKKTAFAICFATLLSACGGGGGSSNVVPSEPVYEPLPPVDTPTFSGNIIKAGADTFAGAGYTGTGTVVAVLDSGVPFSGDEPYDVSKLVSRHFDYDDTQPDGFTEDLSYGTYTGPHGDETSQVIGSSHPEVGIAPDTTLYHGVISDNDGYTNRASIWKGVEWAMTEGADFANVSFSWGGFHYYYAEPVADQTGARPGDVTIKQIADNMVSNEFVVVHSAGNSDLNLTDTFSYDDGVFADGIHTPIKNNLLIVGAMNQEGTDLASFSNYPGDGQDYQDRFILAPGYHYLDNGGAALDITAGTSSAAAHISGAMSLMKQRWNQLSSVELAQIILDTADDTFSGYTTFKHGQGKADFEAAFSPIGVASFNLAGAQYPLEAAALQLPAGFEPSEFKAAFVDEYQRDFETTFAVPSAPYSSRFSDKVRRFGTPSYHQVLEINNGLSLTLGDAYSQSSNQHSPVLGATNFTKSLFTQDRRLNTLSLSAGDYRFHFATNLVEQFDRKNALNPGQRDALGYIVGMETQNYQMLLYVSRENAEGRFYGAESRNSQGVDLRYKSGPLSAGLSVSQTQTDGHALIRNLNTTQTTAHMQWSLIELTEENIRFGLTGELSQSDMTAQLYLPRSVGNGQLNVDKQTLSGEYVNLAYGLYAQHKHLSVSAYADKFDRNLFIGYHRAF